MGQDNIESVTSIDLHNNSSSYFAPATVSSGGGLIHVSGQPGSTDDGKVPGDYESQIHLALLRLRRIIIAANASIGDIVKLALYVVNYGASTRKHTPHLMRFLGKHRPAVTLVPVKQLADPSWLFEVDAVLNTPSQLRIAPPLATPRKSVDVVIIGAGLAGLTAAHDTWSQPIEGGKGTVDVGAAWINDTTQTRVYALAKRFKADLIEQNTQGDCIFQGFDGKCSTFPYGELPNFDAVTRKHLVEIRDLVVEADCQALDAWRPQDRDLDALTFEAYLVSRGASKTALATTTVWTRAMLGVNPADLSALFFLNYCKSGGGLLAMRSDRKGGGQHLRVRQGTQLFAIGLADTLTQGIIHLNTPIQAVTQRDKQEVYVQANEMVLSARKIITTVPSPVLKDISFTPPLLSAKSARIQSTGYGFYTKAMMEFRSPFWIEKDCCGLVQSFVGPASMVRDTSSPSDSKYVLTCFMAGDHGRAWAAKPTKEHEESLIVQLQQLFRVTDLGKDFMRMYALSSHSLSCSTRDVLSEYCPFFPPPATSSSGVSTSFHPHLTFVGLPLFNHLQFKFVNFFF